MMVVVMHLFVVVLLAWCAGVHTTLALTSPARSARGLYALAALAFTVASLGNALAIYTKVAPLFALLPLEKP